MADSSYESEVTALQNFLVMQHPSSAPVITPSEANIQPEDFIAPRFFKKIKSKQVWLHTYISILWSEQPTLGMVHFLFFSLFFIFLLFLCDIVWFTFLSSLHCRLFNELWKPMPMCKKWVWLKPKWPTLRPGSHCQSLASHTSAYGWPTVRKRYDEHRESVYVSQNILKQIIIQYWSSHLLQVSSLYNARQFQTSFILKNVIVGQG